MFKTLLIIGVLFFSKPLFGQSNCPECEKFKIVGVYDFGPPPGGNWIILLLTVTSDLDSSFDPHYSDLYFIDDSADTITIPYGPSLNLPQYSGDTIPYLLALNTTLSNQNFPEDFSGQLVIRTPTGGPCSLMAWCYINFDRQTTAAHEQNIAVKNAIIYPVPADDEIRIRSPRKFKDVSIYDQNGGLILHLIDYKSDERIQLSKLMGTVFFAKLVYQDGTKEFHHLMKSK